MVEWVWGKREEISLRLWLNVYLTRNGVLYWLQSMNINKACQSACLSLHRLSTSQMLMEQCRELPRFYHGHWKARLSAYPGNLLTEAPWCFCNFIYLIFKKARLSAWYFYSFFFFLFFPLLLLEHKKTVHKIHKMGLSLHFLPLLLVPSQLPVSL